MYRELGNALSYLMQIASCQWECKAQEHIRENLIRRLVNSGFAILRLLRLGLHNEAVTLLRVAGELANLLELLTLDCQAFAEWISLSDRDRWRNFRPARVRERIVATGNRAIMDRSSYSAMCEFGVHVTPSSAVFSHQFDGRLHVGGEFAVAAFLMVLNELAIIFGAFLKIAGHFAEVPPDRMVMLSFAGEKLEQTATSWLRITNYRERLSSSFVDDGGA